MNRTITPFALGCTVLAAALAAWGTFGHESGAAEVEGGAHGVGEYLIVLAIIAVAALVVFGWAVPRWASSPAAGRTALVLSVLGVVSVAAFWSGLPPVLAGGGALLGWAARGRATGKLGMALGAFALVADLVVYVADMT